MNEGKTEIIVILILVALIILMGISIWQNYQVIKFLKGVEVYKCLKDLPLP
jgi:hypothetical protein